MEPGLPILVALSLVAITFFGFGAVRTWKRRHVLVSTPIVELAQLRPGFFRSRGRIKSSARTFESPLSNRTCVYYELAVEERRGSGRSRHWYTVVHEEESCRIEIEDATGHAEVDVPNADLKLVEDRHISTGLFASAPRIVEERLMQKYGQTTKSWISNKRMRLRETFLEHGDELHVIGRVAWSESGARFESGGPAFIATDHEFSRLVRRETWSLLVWIMGGLVVAGLCVMLGVSMSA